MKLSSPARAISAQTKKINELIAASNELVAASNKVVAELTALQKRVELLEQIVGGEADGRTASTD